MIYPAVIGEVQEVWTEVKPFQIDGYFVGEDALNYSRFHSYSLAEAKSEQRTLPVLVKYALCHYPEEREIVFLLPYSNFFEEKAKVINMFDKNLLIKCQEDEHLFLPSRVNALPQGFCAGMDYLIDDNGEPYDKEVLVKNILIIDIGFLNTHYLFLRRGKVIQELSFASENGMHLIYKAISAKTGRDIYKIDSWDGVQSLEPLYPQLAGVIQKDVETHYRLKDIGLILLVGGGSSAVCEHLPYEPKILHPSQFGGVRGGAKVARKLWGSPIVSEATAN